MSYWYCALLRQVLVSKATSIYVSEMCIEFTELLRSVRVPSYGSSPGTECKPVREDGILHGHTFKVHFALGYSFKTLKRTKHFVQTGSS